MLHPPGFTQFFGDIRQWGSNRYGWVAFPVAFAQFRKLVTNHVLWSTAVVLQDYNIDFCRYW